MDASTSMEMGNHEYYDVCYVRYNGKVYEILEEDDIVDKVNLIGSGVIEGDIKSFNNSRILMEDGTLYYVSSWNTNSEENLEFDRLNVILDDDLEIHGVKELLNDSFGEYYITSDDKLCWEGDVIVDYLDRIVNSYCITTDGELYSIRRWNGWSPATKIADNVVGANELYYKTTDGRIFKLSNNDEVTENLEEIEEEIEEFEYYYDVNDSSSLSKFRNLTTSFSTTRASFNITYLKENGVWYYNTEYLGGGLS